MTLVRPLARNINVPRLLSGVVQLWGNISVEFVRTDQLNAVGNCFSAGDKRSRVSRPLYLCEGDWETDVDGGQTSSIVELKLLSMGGKILNRSWSTPDGLPASRLSYILQHNERVTTKRENC